jgi:hypothetical protein
MHAVTMSDVKGYNATQTAAMSDYNACKVIYAGGTVSDLNRYRVTHAVAISDL